MSASATKTWDENDKRAEHDADFDRIFTTLKHRIHGLRGPPTLRSDCATFFLAPFPLLIPFPRSNTEAIGMLRRIQKQAGREIFKSVLFQKKERKKWLIGAWASRRGFSPRKNVPTRKITCALICSGIRTNVTNSILELGKGTAC